MTVAGLLAATCTTASIGLSLRNAGIQARGDLSFKTFSILAAGIALWVVYGVLKKDFVIILANSISLCLLAGILWFKIREGSGRAAEKAR